jgi:hypothetical protein
MRPRPDQVSLVFGSRYFAFTLPFRTFVAIVGLPLAARGYYLFTGSMKLLDARVGVAASRPGAGRQCCLSTNSVGTTAAMSKAHHLFSSASYDPDTLNMLGEVLDEVWTSILSGFRRCHHETVKPVPLKA